MPYAIRPLTFQLFVKQLLVCPAWVWLDFQLSHLPERCLSPSELPSPQEPEGRKGGPNLVT